MRLQQSTGRVWPADRRRQIAQAIARETSNRETTLYNAQACDDATRNVEGLRESKEAGKGAKHSRRSYRTDFCTIISPTRDTVFAGGVSCAIFARYSKG